MSKEKETKVINWSDEQKAIFQHFFDGQGNAVVTARAGTGKTTTIINGFNRVKPNVGKILYAVFNKKNQVEASGKITDSRVQVKTLHSLGFGFILGNWKGSKPDSYVERDRVSKVRSDCPLEVIPHVTKAVAFLKNGYINPSLEDCQNVIDFRGIECPDNFAAWDKDLAQIALDCLAESKKQDDRKRISFDDMVWLPVAMGWVKPSFDLVCVDEAQDMNMPQLTMACGACNPSGRIVLVGDDRQAIYGFRGAVCDGMEIFSRKLNASKLGLTITYRCPKSVVRIAASIVPDYKAAPEAPEGEVTSMAEEKMLGTVAIGDVILSRINAPLMKLCLSLIRRNVPARIEGRDIGKMLSYIVFSMKAKSVPDFLQKLETWEAKQIKRATGRYAQAKIDTANDQAETLRAIAEVSASVADIQARLDNLFQDSEYATKPAVVLSSVHKAKGMEWRNVYLLTDTFKGRKSASTEEQRQESNVYYVAVTRSMEKLINVSQQGMLPV